MSEIKRLYEDLIVRHFAEDEQMLFLVGPRQVGKTTLSKAYAKRYKDSYYLNWDKKATQELIIAGSDAVAEELKLNALQKDMPIIIFDEIHKYGQWKNFLKGFYDSYKANAYIIVTGSAKLDVYQRGNDSLMGRYFPYRVHPLSVAECVRQSIPKQEISSPIKITKQSFNYLWEFGGFPEPFKKHDKRFKQRWQRLRDQLLFQEDIRDLSQIQEIAQLELLARILHEQSGQLLNYSKLAQKINVSVNTVKRWLNTLESFYYSFQIRPWTKNVVRSLIKEPKSYLWDWSRVNDVGQRAENFVACHLLKAIHFWTDHGFGEYELYFLRNKEKREVDFLVSKNKTPWFIVEVKYSSKQKLSDSLLYYQQQTKAEHAFQVVFDSEYVDKDCFKYTKPIIVPAQTLLSQLI